MKETIRLAAGLRVLVQFACKLLGAHRASIIIARAIFMPIASFEELLSGGLSELLQIPSVSCSAT